MLWLSLLYLTIIMRDIETMFMQNQNEIGYQIRNCRKYRGFSLKKLSELTGISFVRLSKFERGAEKPTIQIINKMAIFNQKVPKIKKRY